MTAGQDRTPLPKAAKGKRPQFFDDPGTDHLVSMFLELASEVWVLRERLQLLEDVAADKGVILEQELEGYSPPPERAAALAADRQAFIERITFVLERELPGGSSGGD